MLLAETTVPLYDNMRLVRKTLIGELKTFFGKGFISQGGFLGNELYSHLFFCLRPGLVPRLTAFAGATESVAVL